ncbi:MAG: lysophospholipid acyltransferase family protein, partial [Selenomonas noxia]
MLSYYAVKLLSRIVCLLPHGAAMALGTGLARLAWIFIPARRKALAREQVMRCLGVSEEEAARIARASSLRFGPMLMEVLRFPVIKPRMSEYVTITGAVDEVRAAAAAGKGAIFATSHSGNWELMGGAFASAGFPVVGVAKRQSSAG